MVATGTSNGSIKGSNGQFPDHESIAVDTHRTSPYYGRIYIAWAEFNGSGRAPIQIAYSDNDGTTWTGPITVSVTESSTSDGGGTWSTLPVTTTSFDGDKFQACLEFVQSSDCGGYFLGDYIAIASTDTEAQMLWTGDGPQAQDVFSAHLKFP